ncbi:MAG TPA: hypothetical protein VNK50_05470, partial [Calidithermus sp.]|nr:hypothetical protein [Calidithermus sp.]
GRGPAALAAVLALLSGPRPAGACAVCLDAAAGDRGFNAALLALMLMPFAVAAAVGAVLAWSGIGRQPDDTAPGEGPRC